MEQSHDFDITPEPPAPRLEVEQHSSRVWQIEKDLRSCAVEDTAYFGSNAIDQLRLMVFAKRTRRISPDEAGRLLQALRSAAPPLLELFEPHDKTNAFDALRAIEVMLCLHAAGNGRWETLNADVGLDTADRMRWLQNALHNLCLVSQIRERAIRRSCAQLRQFGALLQAAPNNNSQGR